MANPILSGAVAANTTSKPLAVSTPNAAIADYNKISSSVAGISDNMQNQLNKISNGFVSGSTRGVQNSKPNSAISGMYAGIQSAAPQPGGGMAQGATAGAGFVEMLDNNGSPILVPKDQEQGFFNSGFRYLNPSANSQAQQPAQQVSQQISQQNTEQPQQSSPQDQNTPNETTQQNSTPSIQDYINTYQDQQQPVNTQPDLTEVNKTQSEMNDIRQQYQDQVTKVNQQIDSTYDGLQQSIQQLQNGMFPLNPDQQVQIKGLQDSFDRLRAQQKSANDNYVAGITQAGITSGRNRYAPEIEMGNIANAVNVGIQKMADLDSQATSQIAALKQTMMEKNYGLVKDQYTQLQDILKQKSDTLNKIYDQTMSYEKDLRDTNLKLAQDAVDNQLKSQQLSMTQKKQVFDQAMASAQFNETQRKTIQDEYFRQNQADIENKLASDKFSYQQKQDLFENAMKSAELGDKEKQQIKDNYYKQQELDIKRQANEVANLGLGISPGSAPVIMTNTGSPNKIDQANFLASLPPNIATQVKGLADYSLNPADIPTKNNSRANIIALAKQYDPSFDASQYSARAAYNKNYTTGSLMATRNAINTAMTHLGELKDASDALKNAHFTHGGLFGLFTSNYNNLQQLMNEKSGDPVVGKFNTAVDAVASELAKAYKGNASPTTEEIESWKNNLTKDKTPEQIDGVIKTALDLLSGKINAVRSDYQTTMGKTPPGLLNDQTTNSVKNLLNSKVIDMSDLSKIDPGNEWKYQSLKQFYQNNPDQQDNIKKIKQQFPSYSDQDIMQILHEDNGSGFNSPLSTGLNGSIKTQVAKQYPEGSSGGQCTTFLHKLVDFPSIGDEKNQKIQSVYKFGIPVDQWKGKEKIGDVVVSGDNKKNGHTYMINELLPGRMARVTESNYHGDEKVTNNRIVSLDSPLIYGAIRGPLKI